VTEPDVRSHDDGENIFVLVAHVARRATDGQLVLAAGVGIVAAVIVGLLQPGLWLVALPLLCIGSFGVWGIAERTSARSVSGASRSERPLNALAASGPRSRAGEH
jgi:hypothetical protein